MGQAGQRQHSLIVQTNQPRPRLLCGPSEPKITRKQGGKHDTAGKRRYAHRISPLFDETHLEFMSDPRRVMLLALECS
jgi:hypothetical protein